jgi:hypothetical protein
MRHGAKRDEALRFVFEGGNLFCARAPRAPLEVGPCFSTIVLKKLLFTHYAPRQTLWSSCAREDFAIDSRARG